MNKRKIILLLILIVATVIILSKFVFYDRYKMPKGAIIDTNAEKLEVYSESRNLLSLIKDTNVEILTEDFLLDTTTTGEKTVTIDYKYKGFKKYKYDLKYEVVDTCLPIFIKDPPTEKSFYVNEVSNEDIEKLVSKITYADNYDIYPKLEIEGEVKFDEIGTYEVLFTVSDSSKNEAHRTMQVTIKERPVASNDNKEDTKEEPEEEDTGILFADQIQNYKTDGTMVGIDISKWQGEVDFEKIKEAGCEFVIMRVGVMKDKDSELVKDNTFDVNYKNAKKAGLKVGVYVYSEANNVDTAISNAEFIINALNGDKLDFPVVFDWESWSYFNSMEMNLHMLNEMYDAFSKTLKEKGYDSMLYASEYYLNNVWMDLKDYTIWIAKYSTKVPQITNGNNRYILWQNACTGRIDGINGAVDLDIYYK